MNPQQETYIGDGVYASFDGYQIWLRAPQAFGPDHRIALEPAVMAALKRYEQDLIDRLKAGAETPAGTSP